MAMTADMLEEVTEDTQNAHMSAFAQNQPLRIEIKGFKTGHYLEAKTVVVGLVTAGLEGHVECPASLQTTIYSLADRG
jgi:hypothetical protein